MAVSYRNAVSIAELVVYLPSLAVALLLCSRHGFGRSSSFFFLVIFALARVIGPCMELATISDPTNVGLYEGVVILQSIGLSPLMMSTTGLLSRLLGNIQKSTDTFLKTQMLQLVELVIIVALILGIVGGVQSSSGIAQGSYHPNGLNKVGIALFIASFAAIVLATIALTFSVAHADQGEKRILVAVAISLPFMLVRLFYSIMVTYTTDKTFNQLTGSVTVLLCVALIEEFIIVVIYEVVGLTLPQVPKTQHRQGHHLSSSDGTDSRRRRHRSSRRHSGRHHGGRRHGGRRQGGTDNIALRIAKGTIVGRVVTAAMDSQRNKDDIEMGQRY
ncbi:hypothetical protein BP6252_00787 [Coleophoma cylindrospora]|uniref:DUF7702 domain-containing protein n=1 Tax=Coleophoma cylindrospora TaxID=1849047 RepID=A0A3D8SR20_9HELO|nr:hypothetical protein BP6252_00787 [Coleophoma cylindrospora]